VLVSKLPLLLTFFTSLNMLGSDSSPYRKGENSACHLQSHFSFLSRPGFGAGPVNLKYAHISDGGFAGKMARLAAGG
jgi:hypothetical protein